jgi:hypothetical protein
MGYFLYLRRPVPDHPVLVLPPVVDVGIIPLYRTVEIPINVRNAGRQPLILDDFKKSCGCLAVEQRTPEGKAPVTTARVDPEGDLELVLVFTAVESPFGTFRHRVEFGTNDPAQPRAAVEITGRVELGIYTAPREWPVGRLRAGEIVECKITVVDRRQAKPRLPFRILATSSIISIAGPGASAAVQQARQSDGESTYEISATLTAPSDPRDIREHIVIRDTSGADLFRMPVVGVSERDVAVSPSTVVFRLGAAEGTAQRKRRCLCRGKEPFALRVVTCPAGVRASISDCPEPALKLVIVEYDTPPPNSPLKKALDRHDIVVAVS